MKRLICLVVVIVGLLLIGNNAHTFVVNSGAETSKGSTSGGEQSDSERSTTELQESTGSKESESSESGKSIDVSTVIKSVEDARKSSDLSITLGLEALFMQRIRAMEIEGRKPFGSILIATRPLKVDDIGLSANLPGGWVDNNKMTRLQAQASSNAKLTDVIEPKSYARLVQYIYNLAWYGAIVGQAYQYLNEDINALGGIDSIGYDDLMILADGAFDRALTEIKHPMIKNYYTEVGQTLNAQTACLAGSIEQIRVGGIEMTLSASPKMSVSGVQWYGEGKFAGFSGVYSVNTGWSYQGAMEKMKNTSKYRKFAASVEEYADNLKSKGRTREAVTLTRNAYEIAKTGKTSVSPSSLLGGM